MDHSQPLYSLYRKCKRLKRKIRFPNHSTQAHEEKYILLNRAFRSALRNSKKEFESKLETSLNTKTTFRYISSKINKKLKGLPAIVEDNRIIVSDSEKANVLNRFFCSVFNPPSNFERELSLQTTPTFGSLDIQCYFFIKSKFYRGTR